MSPLEMSGSQKNTSNLEPDTTVTDTSVGENGIWPMSHSLGKRLIYGRRSERGGDERDTGYNGPVQLARGQQMFFTSICSNAALERECSARLHKNERVVARVNSYDGRPPPTGRAEDRYKILNVRYKIFFYSARHRTSTNANQL